MQDKDYCFNCKNTGMFVDRSNGLMVAKFCDCEIGKVKHEENKDNYKEIIERIPRVKANDT